MEGIARAAELIRRWPVVRQINSDDRLGLGSAVRSRHSIELKPRISDARVVKSVCPFCAVGCGQRVFVQDGVEGRQNAVRSSSASIGMMQATQDRA
jgi:anaerobic selenocysteine-containing dehydrogenase